MAAVVLAISGAIGGAVGGVCAMEVAHALDCSMPISGFMFIGGIGCGTIAGFYLDREVDRATERSISQKAVPYNKSPRAP